MEKVISEYIKGNFCYEAGSLEFSYPKLEITIQKNEIWEGTFEIRTNAKRETRGFVVSQFTRMECRTEYFDTPTAVIECSFDGRGLEEGEVQQGEICVISSQGEYTLPYVVSVEHSTLECGIGQVKNLFHFANLAKTDWKEAVALFYSPGFKHVFQESDAAYYTAYKGLRSKKDSEQNVEEFLLEINKKQKIEYLPEQTEITLRDVQGIMGYTLQISKSGWGYVSLETAAEGDFLAVEHKLLTEEDFQGNIYKLTYYINAGKLHTGNNYGRIMLKTVYGDIEIPVTVVGERNQNMQENSRRKLAALQMTEYYLDYRAQKTEEQVWMERTEKLVDTYLEFGTKEPVYRLFQAQLLLTRERYNEANWVLEHTASMISKRQNPAVYAYYLYLTTLYEGNPDYTAEVTDTVYELYRTRQDDWRIGWLLLYLDEEFGKSESARWLHLSEMFSHGCTSPILYMEAFSMLLDNPLLLRRMEEFENRVLYFAAKRKLLTGEIIGQIHYLAGRRKQYSEKLHFILEACYEETQDEETQDEETLHTICTHLIKGGKTGKEYFEWYRLAVEKELRITRLYEYYMMSFDRSSAEEIPKMVLLYFAYQSNLDYEKNAFLYAYIVKRRDECPEIYQTYRGNIERFLVEQIKKGNINEDLAFLYKNAVTPAIVEETAEDLLPLLFTNIIYTDNSKMKRIVVVYGKKRGSISYPITNGRAYIPLYGEDYVICQEDEQGNRYIKGIPLNMEKLMVAGSLVRECAAWVQNNPDLDLYLCQGSKHYITIDTENESRAARVVESEDVELSYRHEVSMKLIQYYFEQEQVKKMDQLLIAMEPEQFTSEERAGLIRYMISRELHDKAFEWVCRYGMEGLDAKSIVRLCTRIVSEECMQEQDMLTRVIYYAFRRGKYNEFMLKYLERYFEGTTKQMRDIWKAADKFELDTYHLCGRMLLQMLFSEAFVGEEMEIFASYVKRGAKIEVQMAFLAHLCHEYFVKDRLLDDAIWDVIIQLWKRGEEIPQIVQMAYVKHLAEKGSMPEKRSMPEERSIPEEREAAECFLKEISAAGMSFPFYRRLSGMFGSMAHFADKTMLEYRTKPDCKVYIHYLIEREDGADAGYAREEMEHMYGGIFVKTFVLFFGDNLQYYISEVTGEDEEKEETVMASGTLESSEIGQGTKENRYGIINDMIAGRVLQDYDTVDSLLAEYLETDSTVEHLFTII